MLNIIRDNNGVQIKEPEARYIVEIVPGVMYEADSFRELTAAICGEEYLDCETAETEWHLRVEYAKKIGLFIDAAEENSNVIVYDERIGKIPYSYTDPNPDYEIPANPELIRTETEETFLFSLIKIRYIRIWEKIENNEYQNIARIKNLDQETKEILKAFKDKSISIPLHKKMNE